MKRTGKGRQQPGVEPRTPQLAVGLFIFLYFHLITSKFLYFQHEARCSEHVAFECVVATDCMWLSLLFEHAYG